MTESDKSKIFVRMVYLAFFVLFVILYLVLNGEIPLENIRNLLNMYIIIEIAIITVTFAAMTLRQKMYPDLYGLAFMSAIFLFLDVMTYFYSFLKTTNYFMLLLGLGIVTWFAFLSIMYMIYIIQGFKPAGF